MVVEVRCEHGARRVEIADPQSLPGRRRVIFDTARLLLYVCPRCAYGTRGWIEDGHEFEMPGVEIEAK